MAVASIALACLQAYGIAILARRSGSMMSKIISGISNMLGRTVSIVGDADVPSGATRPGSTGELHCSWQYAAGTGPNVQNA